MVQLLAGQYHSSVIAPEQPGDTHGHSLCCDLMALWSDVLIIRSVQLLHLAVKKKLVCKQNESQMIEAIVVVPLPKEVSDTSSVSEMGS